MGVISGQKHDAKQFKAECVNHTLLHRVYMNENILDNSETIGIFHKIENRYLRLIEM